MECFYFFKKNSDSSDPKYLDFFSLRSKCEYLRAEGHENQERSRRQLHKKQRIPYPLAIKQKEGT